MRVGGGQAAIEALQGGVEGREDGRGGVVVRWCVWSRGNGVSRGRQASRLRLT